MSNFCRGDTAYIYDDGWKKVQIIRVQGDYYHVRRLDRPAAFGASGHRLFTEAEYRSQFEREIKTTYKAPYLH